MSDERLTRAIDLVQAGKLEEARELLEQTLKADRTNMSAWHWYAQTWANPRDKLRVWEACLRFNPTSQQPQEAVRDLRPTGKTVEVTTPRQSTPTARRSTTLLWGSLVLFAGLVAVSVFLMLGTLPKDPAAYRHAQPVEYYLYVPEDYSAEADWPLFVGIHGAGGSGLDCWTLWQSYAEEEGFILLCPSIPGDGGGFYQDVGERTVWSAVGEVKKEYRVQNRMFMAGFSAGAFFIQGFTYHYPDYVSGLAILSSGVYLNPRLFPLLIPMTVVIGDADHPDAVSASQSFVASLRSYGFDIHYELLPGVGHTPTQKSKDLTIELFRKVMNR